MPVGLRRDINNNNNNNNNNIINNNNNNNNNYNSENNNILHNSNNLDQIKNNELESNLKSFSSMDLINNNSIEEENHEQVFYQKTNNDNNHQNNSNNMNYDKNPNSIDNLRRQLPPSSTHPLSYEKVQQTINNYNNNSTLNSTSIIIPRSTTREFSMEEICKHNQRGDCWIVIGGAVYDVSRWAAVHPGGELTILGVAGKDCTDVFTVFHSSETITKQLPRYQIGKISNWSRTDLQKDFHNIIAELEREGKFKTSYWYYFNKALLLACLFCTIVSLIIFPNQYSFSKFSTHGCYVLSSLLLGLFWQQLAFLGHDFGHNGVSGSRGGDLFGSLLTTIFFGVSGQWWKRNHNVHHVHTNSIDCDPDIQHLPFLAVDQNIFKGYWSTYYQKYFQFDLFAQFFVSHQHLLYYLAMPVARINLYLQSFLTVTNSDLIIPNRSIEIGALILYWIWYLILLSFLPTWSIRYYYFAFSHLMCGLIHVQITLSHFAMPVYTGPGYNNDNPNYFLLTQFHTTMDVSCNRIMDWLHGGLQFQIEHHLLPRLPRHNLRYAAEKYIKPLAKKHDISYHSYSFYECNRMVHNTLKQQAFKARNHSNPQIKTSFILRLLMADG